MKTVLIQHASYDHELLLDLTNERHAAYCEAYNIEFQCSKGILQLERNPPWDKVIVINEVLNDPDVEQVIWLDADTIIADLTMDLREAMQGVSEPIGMCHHSQSGYNPPHFNTGVMFIKKTTEMIQFFQRVWQLGPVDHPWHEQVRVNELIKQTPAIVHTLDDKWNATDGVTEVPNPVIRAWHGKTHMTCHIMKEAMYHYNKKDAKLCQQT